MNEDLALPGEEDPEDEGPRLYLLRDLIQHPELLRPPPVVVPRLAWSGRLTMLAAPEKAGKSTLLGQAAACLANGADFLGEPLAPGNVLWLALDEPKGDLVRRLVEYGATDGVVICEERPEIDAIEAAIYEHMVRLLVIDTLMDFAAGHVETASQATEWQLLLSPLSRILRQTGAAGVLSHHVNKATGRYADSRQIGASVDVILEMTEHESDRTVRKVKARGRVPVDDFSLRYVNPWYQLEAGELTLQTRTYRAIESNPGIGTVKLRAAVGGKAGDVDAVVRDLLRTLVIEDRGSGTGHAFHVRPLSVGTGPGQSWDSPPVELLSDAGQRGTGVGQVLGQAHLSHPLTGVGGTGVGGQIPRCSLHDVPQRQRTDGLWRCPACAPESRWRAA